MKALILAGGFGTRLRPLTYTRPKHLLPIGNRPHIEHVFDLLQNHGIDHAILLTSYLAESFAATVEAASAGGLRVDVTHEVEPLGTAGAIKNAEPLIGDSTFLVFNGDILCDFDLAEMVRRHHATGAGTTIALVPVEDPSAFGVVPRDGSGKVLGFIEKPPRAEAPTNEINAGVYAMEPAVLDLIPAGEVWSAERSLFPDMVRRDDGLYATTMDGYWMDIGTPAKYLEANLDLLAGRWRANGVTIRDGCVVAADARIAADAELSSTCVGAAVSIQPGAKVDGSVLLPGAIVGAGARVEGCILGERAVVEDEAHHVGATVADGDVLRREER